MDGFDLCKKGRNMLTNWKNEYIQEHDKRVKAESELKRYRDTGLEPEQAKDWANLNFGPTLAKCCHDELDRLCNLVGGLDRLCELAEAGRGGRCVMLPPDGQIYYIEESEETGEKWIGNRPCRYITSEGYWCGWGVVPILFEFSKLGKTVFLTHEAAAAALKENNHGI